MKVINERITWGFYILCLDRNYPRHVSDDYAVELRAESNEY